MSQNAKGTTRKILNLNVFENLVVIVPPMEEQKRIAEYLDKETSLIDRYVDKLTALREKYQLLKRALISETISRGLPHHNPDSFRPLRLKDILFSLETGKREATNDEEVLSIGGEHIQNGQFYLGNPRYVTEELYISNKGKIQ